MSGRNISDEDVETLLKDIVEVSGYNFYDYSRASLKRRINRLYMLDKHLSFAEFRYKIKSDGDYLKRFVEEITVNVTEMFRDPHFYKTLRSEVLPLLATFPFIRIWHAGCSTGEEVYSMAIMLKELNLLHKCILYATDINHDVLEKARKGVFPVSFMKQFSENYQEAGGTNEFSAYYTAKYDKAKFNEELSNNMIFAQHNLVSDGSFNEFQLIICRNVLIYFDRPLQETVFKLFDNSLEALGFLALGSKETLKFSAGGNKYQQLGNEKIWRKYG